MPRPTAKKSRRVPSHNNNPPLPVQQPSYGIRQVQELKQLLNYYSAKFFAFFQTAESHYTRKKHTTTTPPKQLQKLMDERNAQPLPPPTPFPKPPRKFLTEEDRWAFICENITDESRARWQTHLLTEEEIEKVDAHNKKNKQRQ